MNIKEGIKYFLKSIGLYSVFIQFYDFLIETYNFCLIIKFIKKNGSETNLFLFFPSYATGGAELVHLNILQAVSHKHPVIFITGQSPNEHYKKEFSNCGTLIELIKYLRKSSHFLYPLFVAAITKKINSTPRAVVFGADSKFMYEIICPLIPPAYAPNVVFMKKLKKVLVCHRVTSPHF